MCVGLHTDTPSKGQGWGGVFALDFAKISRFVNIMFIMGICIYNKINDLADLCDFVQYMHSSSCN